MIRSREARSRVTRSRVARSNVTRSCVVKILKYIPQCKSKFQILPP